MVNRDILFRFLGDSRDLERASKKAASAMSPVRESAEKTTKKLDGISKAINVAFGAAAIGAIGRFAGSTIKAASTLEESVNAVNVVFGDASDVVLEFGEDAADSVGLAASEFNQLSTTVGSLLQNFGFSASEAADETIRLTRRAADMASVFDTDVADALGAIQAALRGESEPIRRFAVSLSDAQVRAKAVALGLADTTASVDEHGKAVARLELIYEQTEQTAGDFENTSGSLANTQRRLQANLENISAEIGSALIPLATDLLNIFADLLQSRPFQFLLEGVKNFSINMKLAALEVENLAGNILTLGINEIFDDQKDIEKEFLSALRNVATAAETTEDRLVGAAEAFVFLGQNSSFSERRLKIIQDTLGLTDDQMQAVTKDVLKFADANNVTGEAVDWLKGKLDLAEDSSIRYTRAIAEGVGEQRAHEAATRDWAQTLLGVGEGMKENMRIADQLASVNTRSKNRVLDHGLALTSLEQDLRDAAAAQQSLTDVMRSAIDPVFAARRASLRYAEVLRRIDKDGKRTNDELLELADAKLDLDAAFENLDSAEEIDRAIQGLATTLGISRNKARKLLEELGLLDGTTVRAKARVEFDVEGDSITIAGTTIPVFVTGGGQVVLHEGGIVPGPRGQEVAALLQAGERVISLKDQEQAERVARNSGTPMPFSPGGSAIHFNFAGPVVGGPQLVQEIREKMVLAQRRGATVAKV